MALVIEDEESSARSALVNGTNEGGGSHIGVTEMSGLEKSYAPATRAAFKKFGAMTTQDM